MSERGPAEATPTIPKRAAIVYRALVGPRPALTALLLLPTLCGLLLDFYLRREMLGSYPSNILVKYFASALVSAGFWVGILWLMAALHERGGRVGQVVLVAFVLVFVMPFSFFAYGGQAIYFRVFNTYIARDTIRLGLELGGTIAAWITAWGSKMAPAVASAVGTAALVFWIVRKTGPSLSKTVPILPVICLGASIVALAKDYVATKSLQAAPPDSCFMHGVVGLCHEKLFQKGPPRGLTQRRPEPLPPLEKSARQPNVILVITESVRADAMCSKKTPTCASRFLDDVIPDRLGLLKMTTQSSGTYSACMVLWTGLSPDADFSTVHKAPFLWEVAKAVGYETGYFSAQNLLYKDLMIYLKVSGIDEMVSAAEIGHIDDPAVGAPDEMATERLVTWIKARKAPYFTVLHLSNTHWPYRVDPALQPFEPHNDDPMKDLPAARNHYKNSVLMQERTIADMFKQLKQLPSWEDTAVLFVSDHGEQFREHGGFYHLNNLFDEEVRTPGFLVAGSRVLSEEQRAAFGSYENRRVYSDDVNSTIVDLLGAFDARPRFPFAAQLTGRSLLRPQPPSDREDPIVAASTSSGVWLDDNPVYGVMSGDRKLMGADAIPWLCYDVIADPIEHKPMSAKKCPDLLAVARKRWPMVPVPK